MISSILLFLSSLQDSTLSDIYVPKCWVDLKFKSRIILDFFLFWNSKLQKCPKNWGEIVYLFGPKSYYKYSYKRLFSISIQIQDKKKSRITIIFFEHIQIILTMVKSDILPYKFAYLFDYNKIILNAFKKIWTQPNFFF